LRRALTALGRVAVELRRDNRVARHPDPLLGQYGRQINCGRQFGLGGTAQMLGDLVPLGFVLRPRRQRQSIAEAALGAAGSGRALVPAMCRLEVAHFLRAAGQHIGEHRLSLGGTGLGRRPCPF
jgi:hypothetical protein